MFSSLHICTVVGEFFLINIFFFLKYFAAGYEPDDLLSPLRFPSKLNVKAHAVYLYHCDTISVLIGYFPFFCNRYRSLYFQPFSSVNVV